MGWRLRWCPSPVFRLQKASSRPHFAQCFPPALHRVRSLAAEASQAVRK